MQFWRTTEVMTLRQMAGSDAMTVAAALGRTPRAVQDMARRQGAPVPRQQHVLYWPIATKRRARAMRASGHTVNQISAALGVPFGTVRRWIYEGAAA